MISIPKLPRVGGLVTIVKGFTMAHRPELLLGTSIASTLGAVVLAAKGGYESGQQVMRAEYEDLDLESPDGKSRELDVKEKIQLTWMNYLPAAGATTASIGATSALHLVHVKEKKALAQAAMAAIEEVRAESKAYVDDLVKAVEGNTDEATQQAIADDAIDPDRDGKADALQNTNHEVEELYLVRDGKTGRDIWSNERRIEEAVNNINNWVAKHGDCDLNTFYSNAGFESIPDGDDWGWSGAFVELKWDEVRRDDGRPVRRFAFRTDPEKGYDRPVK